MFMQGNNTSGADMAQYLRMSNRAILIHAVSEAKDMTAAMAVLDSDTQADITPDSIMSQTFRGMHDAVPESAAPLRAELTMRAERAEALEACDAASLCPVEMVMSLPQGTMLQRPTVVRPSEGMSRSASVPMHRVRANSSSSDGDAPDPSVLAQLSKLACGQTRTSEPVAFQDHRLRSSAASARRRRTRPTEINLGTENPTQRESSLAAALGVAVHRWRTRRASAEPQTTTPLATPPRPLLRWPTF